MRIEADTADRAQEAAYQNADVVAIVKAVLLFPAEPKLFRIAYEGVISPAPADRATLQSRLGGATANPALVDAAVAIAEAGARIAAAGGGDAELRKGALLERLVFSLVELRRPGAVTRETHVVLAVHPHSGKAKTGRKDVVVDADPFEAYECKFGAGIEQWELDELGDVFATAEAEGTQSRPCVATMGPMVQFQNRIAYKGLALHSRLYFAGLEELPRLSGKPPSLQVA